MCFSGRARIGQQQGEGPGRAAAEPALAELEGASTSANWPVCAPSVSSSFGGLRGELSREDLPPALADVVFELGEGEWSELLKADYRLPHLPRRSASPARSADARGGGAKGQGAAGGGVATNSCGAAAAEVRWEYNLGVAVEPLSFEYYGVCADPDAPE